MEIAHKPHGANPCGLRRYTPFQDRH